MRIHPLNIVKSTIGSDILKLNFFRQFTQSINSLVGNPFNTDPPPKFLHRSFGALMKAKARDGGQLNAGNKDINTTYLCIYLILALAVCLTRRRPELL